MSRTVYIYRIQSRSACQSFGAAQGLVRNQRISSNGLQDEAVSLLPSHILLVGRTRWHHEYKYSMSCFPLSVQQRQRIERPAVAEARPLRPGWNMYTGRQIGTAQACQGVEDVIALSIHARVENRRRKISERHGIHQAHPLSIGILCQPYSVHGSYGVLCTVSL